MKVHLTLNLPDKMFGHECGHADQMPAVVEGIEEALFDVELGKTLDVRAMMDDDEFTVIGKMWLEKD